MGPDTQTPRYAWLEHEEGMWHFLTDLFSDPGDSTRSWSDSLGALEELRKEGWTVVAPYPDSDQSTARGYGLHKSGMVTSINPDIPMAFTTQEESAPHW